MWRCMTVELGGGGGHYVRSTRPIKVSAIFIYWNIKRTFLMRLLYCFWNNFRWILCENIVSRLSWNSETAANSGTLWNSGNHKIHIREITIFAEKVTNLYVYVYVYVRIYEYMCMYMCICRWIFFIHI